MATVNYSDYCNSRAKSSASTKDFKVGYFNSLVDDGDEAIVRFVYSTVDDFKLQTVHSVTVNGKFRNVACLKEHVYDANDLCPLCASGNPVKTRFFVKLVEYTKDDNGKVTASSKVWSRPANFTKKIISAFNAAVDMGIYAPTSAISDVVFKITRNGAAGNKDTDYTVNPTNPVVYKEELYTKDFSDFDDFDLAHHSYMVRTFDEIKEFLDTGNFPMPKRTTVQSFTNGGTDTVTTKKSDVTPMDTTVTSTATGTTAPRKYRF